MPPISTISMRSMPGASILWFARIIAGATNRNPTSVSARTVINVQSTIISILQAFLRISDDDRVLLDEGLSAWSENERLEQFVAASAKLGWLLGMREDGVYSYLVESGDIVDG